MMAVTKSLRSPHLRSLYQEFEDAYYGGLRAASRVLQTLVELKQSPELAGARYGASLRLAFALAGDRTTRSTEREGPEDNPLGNKSLEVAWREFGSVAPFGAAARLLQNQCNARLRARGEGFFAD